MAKYTQENMRSLTQSKVYKISMNGKLKNIDVFFLQYTYKPNYNYITYNHYLRIFKGKEEIKRAGEKFCIYSQKLIKKFGYMPRV